VKIKEVLAGSAGVLAGSLSHSEKEPARTPALPAKTWIALCLQIFISLVARHRV
jgi:hypothetical protein